MRNRNIYFSLSFLMFLSSCEPRQESSVNGSVPVDQTKVTVAEEPVAPFSASAIFENKEDVISATNAARRGDQKSMALLEEHFKQTSAITSAIYWQDKLIEKGSIRAMVRKATLLAAVYGPKACPQAIGILREAVAKSKSTNERKLASEHLAAMTGGYESHISCLTMATNEN